MNESANAITMIGAQLAEFDAVEAGLGALEKVRAAAPLLLDALRQWAAAERDGDADELANARASRDAAIAAATN